MVAGYSLTVLGEGVAKEKKISPITGLQRLREGLSLHPEGSRDLVSVSLGGRGSHNVWGLPPTTVGVTRKMPGSVRSDVSESDWELFLLVEEGVAVDRIGTLVGSAPAEVSRTYIEVLKRIGPCHYRLVPWPSPQDSLVEDCYQRPSHLSPPIYGAALVTVGTTFRNVGATSQIFGLGDGRARDRDLADLLAAAWPWLTFTIGDDVLASIWVMLTTGSSIREVARQLELEEPEVLDVLICMLGRAADAMAAAVTEVVEPIRAADCGEAEQCVEKLRGANAALDRMHEAKNALLSRLEELV